MWRVVVHKTIQLSSVVRDRKMRKGRVETKKSLSLLWHPCFQYQRVFGLSVYRDDCTSKCSLTKRMDVFINIYLYGQGSL